MSRVPQGGKAVENWKRLARILVRKSTSSDSDDESTSPGQILARQSSVWKKYLTFLISASTLDIRSPMRELLFGFMMVVKFFCREKETL